METLEITFGPGYKNNENKIWSIRRQVIAARNIYSYENIFTASNTPSSLTTVTIPLRGGGDVSPSYTYNNIKAVIFKNFNKFLFTEHGCSDSDRWFGNYNSTYGYALNKFDSDTDFYFDKGNIESANNPLGITPLAIFPSKSQIVTTAGQEFSLTFTNPIFTEAGKDLSKWFISSDSDEYAWYRLYLGIYLDEESPEKDLNWAAPSGQKTATLNLAYSSSSSSSYLIKYHDNSKWKNCQLHYHDGSGWRACRVNYFSNNEWKTIG